MVDGDTQHLTDKPLWNIEIAFIANTRGMYTNVLNAVMEMNQHYPAKLIHDIKVRPYQSLNTLFDHNHSLRLSGNEKLIHIAYNNNQLEIETKHEYEDTKVEYFRTTTVWLSDGGVICSESKGINEGITVSTEDVPLTYVDLPFGENRLFSIEMQKNEQDKTATNVLLLTIQQLYSGKPYWASRELLSIDLNDTPMTINRCCDENKGTMRINQYRNQQCYYLYELQGI